MLKCLDPSQKPYVTLGSHCLVWKKRLVYSLKVGSFDARHVGRVGLLVQTWLGSMQAWVWKHQLVSSRQVGALEARVVDLVGLFVKT